MLKEKREIYRSRILKRAVSIISVYSSAMYYRAISLHYKHIYKVVINSILTVKGKNKGKKCYYSLIINIAL